MQTLEARMIECARQALAADAGSYAFGPDALHEVWAFVHEMTRGATEAGQPPAKLIEKLIGIEDPDDRALSGAAREAACRLAADAGVEVPPPAADEALSPMASVADRTLAVFLAKKANLFNAAAAWGVSEAGFWIERAAGYLFRREAIFLPPAGWVALYACWEKKRSEGAKVIAVPEKH
ncbi:hypothetical protein [Sabulicella glaciei]|uniref:Uncharacterized protein n=1 Tax=Sabulicella glaciei TaxID=2984948 RepID=A0ABT3P206_9PROT|nr:hypothetical protein [Roseococcus sp. MDT2-1-1]MCW8088223.1 hypothetical protein [Roseococcus sp. MDT2-1-1]